MKLLMILGDQLFPLVTYANYKDSLVFMKEDNELCTHFKYHKHKIIFFLASMRRYAKALKENGFKVLYKTLDDGAFTDCLTQVITQHQVTEIHMTEIQDKFFEIKIKNFCKANNLQLVIIDGPMFLSSRENFYNYLANHRKPLMKSFYELERVRLDLMMDGKAPWGGKWSFDDENRNKVPKVLIVENRPKFSFSSEVEEVKQLVKLRFSDHPGSSDNFWLPTNREDALKVLEHFLIHYLHSFGTYQDSITNRHPFLFHSILSPMINNGLINPGEVVQKAIDYFEGHQEKVPINSLEGFVRQIIGWREFVRGIYQSYSEQQDQSNFFKHTRKLTVDWYQGTTGIPPVDDAIIKARKYGYCHHIERLMVISNFMLLCEIDPKEVHRWFMEMFVDSADWVMGPNVYGMGQFSDGGIFSTKPYISGSNYIHKMSDYKKGEWSDVWDGLFWKFIDKNRDFMKKQHRLGFMVITLDKMSLAKKETLFSKAKEFILTKTR